MKKSEISLLDLNTYKWYLRGLTVTEIYLVLPHGLIPYTLEHWRFNSSSEPKKKIKDTGVRKPVWVTHRSKCSSGPRLLKWPGEKWAKTHSRQHCLRVRTPDRSQIGFHVNGCCFCGSWLFLCHFCVWEEKKATLKFSYLIHFLFRCSILKKTICCFVSFSP